jgi:hypothetical protein
MVARAYEGHGEFGVQLSADWARLTPSTAASASVASGDQTEKTADNRAIDVWITGAAPEYWTPLDAVGHATSFAADQLLVAGSAIRGNLHAREQITSSDFWLAGSIRGSPSRPQFSCMLQVTSSEFRGKFESVPSHIFEAPARWPILTCSSTSLHASV